MTDDDANDRERAEAEALARALDRPGGEQPGQDLLETAALLRYSGRGGELSGERSDAILDELLAAAPEADVRQAAPRRHRLRRWLPVGVGLAAVAAVVLTLLVPRSSPGPVPARSAQVAVLPRPSARLLSLQAQAGKAGASRRALDAEMHGYRRKVFRTLEASYPPAVGLVVPGAPGPRGTP